MSDEIEALKAKLASPVPLVLHCPECRARHVDEGEWATRVHHTHSCQSCGLTWRPAVVATVGVRFLPGFKTPDVRGQARGSSTVRSGDETRAGAPLRPTGHVVDTTIDTADLGDLVKTPDVEREGITATPQGRLFAPEPGSMSRGELARQLGNVTALLHSVWRASETDREHLKGQYLAALERYLRHPSHLLGCYVAYGSARVCDVGTVGCRVTHETPREMACGSWEGWTLEEIQKEIAAWRRDIETRPRPEVAAVQVTGTRTE